MNILSPEQYNPNYQNPQGDKFIQYLSGVVDDDVVRVTYTALHNEETVENLEAIAYWSMGLLYEQIASHYAGEDAELHQEYTNKSTLAFQKYDLLLNPTSSVTQGFYFPLLEDHIETEIIEQLGWDNVYRATEHAIEKYSKDKPKKNVVDIQTINPDLIDVPEGFLNGFSTIELVEYPVEAFPTQYIGHQLYDRPNQKIIRFIDKKPEIKKIEDVPQPETVRVTYTTKWTLWEIKGQDLEALACWAAALLCDEISTKWR